MRAGVLVCVLGGLGSGIFVVLLGCISGKVVVLGEFVIIALHIECSAEFQGWQSRLLRFQPKGQEERGVLHGSVEAVFVTEHE